MTNKIVVLKDQRTPVEGTPYVIDEFQALVAQDGMGTLAADFQPMKAHLTSKTAPLFPMPDSIPERKVIIDQALSILRGLRARDAERAKTLANEVLGY